MKESVKNYDPDKDVLYIRFHDTSNSYGDEVINDMVVMRDMNTHNVTGITIIGLKKKHGLYF